MTFPMRVAPPHEGVMEIRHDGECFASFDGLVAAAQPSSLFVRTREEDLEPILAHASRRLRAAGCRVVEVLVRSPGVSVFREAATQLGVGPLSCEARTFASALGRGRVAIVATMPKEGSWDDAVARELAVLREVVLVLVATAPAPSWAERTIEITSELTLY